MNRTYKLIASRGTEIVFDDRIDAPSPRHARHELKQRLGLKSLSGVVYAITEIPVDLIRQIVDARVAELAGGAPIQAPVPADVEELVMTRLKPILARLATLEHSPPPTERPQRFDPLAELPAPATDPNWDLVKRHFRRYGDPRKTSEKYGIPLRDLNTRAKREGWAA